MGIWGPRQSPPGSWQVPQLEQGTRGQGGQWGERLAEQCGDKWWHEMDLGVTAEVGRPCVEDTEVGLILLRSQHVSVCGTVSGPSGQESVSGCASGADCWSESAYGQAEGPPEGPGVGVMVATGQQQPDCTGEELWAGPGSVRRTEVLAGEWPGADMRADCAAPGEPPPAVWECFAAAAA